MTNSLDKKPKKNGDLSLFGNIRSAFGGNSYVSLIIIILIVWAIFNHMSGGLFLSPRNMGTLLLQTSILGFVTVGMIVVMIARGIDLAAGQVIAAVVAIGAVLNIERGANPVVVLMVMFAAGIAIGSFQGFFVAKLGLPAFIVTLAGQLYLRGFSLIVSNGQEVVPVAPMINSLSVSWVPPTPSIVGVIIAFSVIIDFHAEN